MKQSVIDMTNIILSDMDSEPVDTLSDSDEAEQVAVIIKQSFYAMISNREWPHLKRGTNLEPFSDPSKPTHMKLNENVTNLLTVSYNKVASGETKNDFQEVKYLDNDAFLRKTNGYDNDESNVDVVLDDSGIQFHIKNDKQPNYYTSFDDENLVFDSYDSSVDTSLQDSKVQAIAYIMPVWDGDETAKPDLPANAFVALIEMATARCFYRLKQMNDPASQRESEKQQAYLSRKARKIDRGVKRPQYGRRR